MNKFILSASILSADFSKLAQQISEAEKGGVDWIHIDVMDGNFVPNITMGAFIVETCSKITNLPLDVHLMIDKPDKHIKDFVNAGATRLSVHIENNPNIHRTLQEINNLGCAAGIVINPGTPVYSIDAIYDDIKHILLMSVNPGFSGQKFIHRTIDKIINIREKISSRNLPIYLQVDGGINSQTLPLCFKAGADVFIAATSIFKHPNGIDFAIQELRNSIS